MIFFTFLLRELTPPKSAGGMPIANASNARVESCSPQVRGIYTDGELTLDVATFESGLVRELRISIRGSVCTLRGSRMTGAVFGV
jgi:hypothetical protein